LNAIIHGFDLTVFYIWLSWSISVCFLFFFAIVVLKSWNRLRVDSSQNYFNWKLDFNSKNLVWVRVVCECFTMQLSKSGCFVKYVLHRYNEFYVRSSSFFFGRITINKSTPYLANLVSRYWTVLQATMKTREAYIFFILARPGSIFTFKTNN
jgi:hypothetical protein